MGRWKYRYKKLSSTQKPLLYLSLTFAASEAVTVLKNRGLDKTTGASIELIASDVLDHYRTYSLLEKLLGNPNKLQEQFVFQIEPLTRQLLIEKLVMTCYLIPILY